MAPLDLSACLASHFAPRQAHHPSYSLCRNARARAFLLRYTRCNVCIATGRNVHVHFQHGGFVCSHVLSAQGASTRALLRFDELWRAALSQSVQGGENPLGDFVDLAETVHLDEQAARAVDLK